MHRRLVALALCSAMTAASAQLLTDKDPDWKEIEAPPPGALRTSGLIPLDIPSNTAMRFGVDPQSITVGKDGIVRYVVVATSSSGVVNAMYEGINCAAGQVRVYARHNPDSGWVTSKNEDWRVLRDDGITRHSLVVARSGACYGSSPNGVPQQIVRDLRAPLERRFERGGVNQ